MKGKRRYVPPPRDRVEMRFPVALLAEWDERAREKGVSRTKWLVDHLEKVFGGNLKPVPEFKQLPRARRPKPPPPPCTHPREAEERFQYMTRCGLCGKRIR
jgi:hypothetical protein